MSDMNCRAIFLLLWLLPFAARAAGPHGLQPGWVIDDSAPNNGLLFTDASARRLTEAGAGWMRLNFRLAGHASWDATLLGRYDIVVDTARRHGIQIVALVGHEARHGSQADWQANARETGGGSPSADGSNAYMAGLSETAVQLMARYRGRIRHWELWNEPNAWTVSYGVGGPFIYPSNFAAYVGHTYSRAREEGISPDVQILTGGIFAHDIGGRDRAHATAGDYLPATYRMGRRLGEHLAARPAWNWSEILEHHGTYPVDALGYHFYLDSGANSGITDTTSIGQYLDWFRDSYRSTAAEGSGSEKPVFITEFGFQTWPDNDPSARAKTLANQATSMTRAMAQIKARPWVQTAIAFQELDNPAASLYYGMYTTEGTAKPARDALREASTFEGRYADGTIHQGIRYYFAARGQGQMGSPVDRGRGPYVVPFLDGAHSQDYDGGALGPLVVVAGPYGNFGVAGAMREAYGTEGVPAALGPPVGESAPFGEARRQSFRHGFLVERDGLVTRNLYGDVDGNGSIGVADAAEGLRIAAGLASPDPAQAVRADVHPPGLSAPGDGRVSFADAVRILLRAGDASGGLWP